MATLVSEYIANLDEARDAYVLAGLPTTDPERAERRARAFDRMIREIQDEAYEEGENDALAFGRDGH